MRYKFILLKNAQFKVSLMLGHEIFISTQWCSQYLFYFLFYFKKQYETGSQQHDISIIQREHIYNFSRKLGLIFKTFENFKDKISNFKN